MARTPLSILVLCTGNSARSILAECLLNRLGDGRIKAFSAGSTPIGQVNKHAINILKSKGYMTSNLRSKSWDVFAGTDAPALDIIITVCDNAAGEVCPVWPGDPACGHWGIPDPASASLAAFETAYGHLLNRVAALLALPIEEMSSAAIADALKTIQENAV